MTSTEPADHGAPSPSLTQQRIALRRRRAFALAGIIVFSVLVAGALVFALIEAEGDRWMTLIGPGVGLFASIAYFMNTTSQVSQFDLQHGRDAGAQP